MNGDVISDVNLADLMIFTKNKNLFNSCNSKLLFKTSLGNKH